MKICVYFKAGEIVKKGLIKMVGEPQYFINGLNNIFFRTAVNNEKVFYYKTTILGHIVPTLIHGIVDFVTLEEQIIYNADLISVDLKIKHKNISGLKIAYRNLLDAISAKRMLS